MEKKSIGKNFAYNIILKVANIVFPLITFPYVTRVLGAEGIGKVNFASSIVMYFVLFANLGIPLYGIREIAKVRDKKEEMSKVFWELFILNGITVIICGIAFMSTFLFVDKIRSETPLFLITGLMLIMSMFSLEWFYSGVEDYKYISIRNIMVKIISMICLFLLVKNKDDYVIYGSLGVISSCGNNIFNVIYLKKYINFNLKEIKLTIRRHFKPIFYIFMMLISVSLYYNINPVIIGFLSTNENVGYFSTYMRILSIILGLISAYTTVIFPRFTYHIENKNEEEYNKLSKKSLNFINYMIFPIMMLLFAFGKEIISVFAGDDFAGNITAFYIMIPVIYFSSISVLLGVQILLPYKQEKKTIWPPIVGAITNILISVLFIKEYGINAVSMSFLMAEAVVFGMQWYFAVKVKEIKLINKNIFYYILVTCLEGIIIMIIKPIFKIGIFEIGLITSISFIIYNIILFILKDESVLELIEKLNLYIKKGEKNENNIKETEI